MQREREREGGRERDLLTAQRAASVTREERSAPTKPGDFSATREKLKPSSKQSPRQRTFRILERERVCVCLILPYYTIHNYMHSNVHVPVAKLRKLTCAYMYLCMYMYM